MTLKSTIWCLSALLFFACGDKENRVFDKNLDIPGGEWDRDFVPEFEFTIEDTTAAYNFFYNVRNTQEYPYHNLYLHFYLMDTDKSILEEDVHEMYLFDPQTGTPSTNVVQDGSVGALYFNTFLCIRNYKFDKPGKYYFKIKNYMRSSSLNEEKPLPEIFSIGLKVTKVN